ncbi:AMP-binding protein [Nitriliruptor alkaliphilus]|uniref:AMP-binding protein n=1 Tax=Nitriliruptor alkaliphilus TaxID=427918 RepID=UPI000698C166|nr:AMP-binding protein [Nitriliruptor alkaliphilus]
MTYPGERAQITPDKPAYIMEPSGVVVTYRELDDDSNRIAQVFHEAGLRPGDTVSMQLENHPIALKVVWAAQRSGLFYTAISTALQADEVAYIVDDCDAKVHVTTARFSDIAENIVDRTPKVELRLSIDGEVAGHQPLEERMAATDAEPIPEEVEGGDLLYSSGTTGTPKGVKPDLEYEPAGNPPPIVGLMHILWGFDEETVYLSPAPLYHAAPLRFMLGVNRLGGTIVMMESWDTEQSLALIEKHRITHAQFVPTMFVRMLKLPEGVRTKYDVSSLGFAVHAAAPCPIPVKQQMMDWWGEILHEYYGGTEGNGITAITPQEWLQHPGSVGKGLLGEVKICDDDDHELPPGEAGNVYFADGPDFDYHKDPERTAQAYNSHGWSTMGDVGYVDDDGYLFLTDRKAYTIISGGVNVYPQEAENVLTMHPDVVDVAVFGIPNEEFGEEVKAVVQARDGVETGPALAQELIDYCKERLSSIKCPRSVDFRNELPRTATGKLIKRLVRESYLDRAPADLSG